MRKIRLFIYFNVLNFVNCGYIPSGDEVQAGSVLLPASRRGRYLANIIRRQAVDGTGIKFHKDADRMNAEAKKKVDVLSEELLPYIIAEQERRTTLHKRIMTAIQNGEKGVTIAEIRNKPPLIIRKGLMYRCPANRAPKEPDGSGILMCEDGIVPTQVMYDSCLSAEDKELYNAENKYFFCNRHKIEGPDLPRNGSTVIGCAPIERTSLNYTISRCTLEDTDDIVVHYRYYPDRTYKFVTELDPDHEVCEHWNPCQIGYIYSLPSADQATPASELWRDLVERNEEYERDEIIPAVPEDSMEETIYPRVESYTTSPRKIPLPRGNTTSRRAGGGPGYDFIGVRFKKSTGPVKQLPDNRVLTKVSSDGLWLIVTLVFPKWRSFYYGTYFAVIKDHSTGKEVSRKLVTLSPAVTAVIPSVVMAMTGQRLNNSATPYKCNRCRIKGVMVRGTDGNIYNVDRSRYGIKEDVMTHEQNIEVTLTELKAPDFGDYFIIVINGDGAEERVKILSVHSPEKDINNEIQISRVSESFDVGEHYDRTTNYVCNDCKMTEILCNGESVLSAGRVSIIPVSKMISLNFPRFEDSYSCVYMGIFTTNNGRPIRKVVAVLENHSPAVTIAKVPVIPPPTIGQTLEQEISFTCSDCTVTKVHVNGLELMNYSIGKSTSENAAYLATASSIAIHVSEFSEAYEGVYQAIFEIKNENVTKTIMEIQDGTPSGSNPASDKAAVSGETTVAGDAAGVPAVGVVSGDAAGDTTPAAGGDAASGEPNADATTEAPAA